MNWPPTAAEEAPMARSTPISRRRSSTLSESTPLSARLPTTPISDGHGGQQRENDGELRHDAIDDLD